MRPNNFLKCENREFESIDRASVEKHTHIKHQVCSAENTEKGDMYNESSEKDQNLKCKLCHVKFANNEETKTHYVKEHMTEINVSSTVNECDHIYCMDTEEDKYSKYCFYYKHLIESKNNMTNKRVPSREGGTVQETPGDPGRGSTPQYYLYYALMMY